MTNNTTIVVFNVNTKVLENINNLSSNHSMQLGERLKQARAYAKISQEELALRLNASQSLISKIERGEQEETTLIVKIAKICGVSIQWMDDGEGEMLVSKDYEMNERLQVLHKIAQTLPDYALDEVIRDALKTVELITKAQESVTQKLNGTHK